jgi:hypothetical protein
MNTNPYLLLIDNCLEKLGQNYGTSFKYQIERHGIAYKFTIFQDNDPIFYKEVPVFDDTEMIDYVHYSIARDFFIGSIERIFMQRENEKKIFPRDHAKIKEENPKIIKGIW